VAEPTVSLLRRMLPFLTLVLLVAVAYDGWVFYSCWSYARQAERTLQKQEAADARLALDMLRGGSLKILSFYATPGAIRRGDHANLCFGVIGAQSVRMEPAIEALHPALSSCPQVSPAKGMECKLVAEDGGGQAATSTVAIRVIP
jgi:hypothetical protein